MATPARKKRITSTIWREEATIGITNGDTSGESVGAENKAAQGTWNNQGKPRESGRTRPISLSNSSHGLSLFQLQIDELLSKVRPDYERRMVKAETALRKLKEIIERIPNRDARSVCRFAHMRRVAYLILLFFPDRGS